MQSKIGFIGLGAMGKPMAANIARAGFELTVCDLREEPCQELAALGATVVASPRELRKRAIS
jgi:3-hydroxyisobutyrate dehydrogenase-like beta-hydroxyacid dehydrogenase